MRRLPGATRHTAGLVEDPCSVRAPTSAMTQPQPEAAWDPRERLSIGAWHANRSISAPARQGDSIGRHRSIATLARSVTLAFLYLAFAARCAALAGLEQRQIDNTY